MSNSIVSINSKQLYLPNNFKDIKENIQKHYKKYTDMGSFLSIEFENYDFVLNEILHLDIYIKSNDNLINKRIEEIENDIKDVITGFKFENKYVN